MLDTPPCFSDVFLLTDNSQGHPKSIKSGEKLEKGFWGVDYFSESLHMKLAKKHAALIVPSILDLVKLPLDHPFEEKLFC